MLETGRHLEVGDRPAVAIAEFDHDPLALALGPGCDVDFPSALGLRARFGDLCVERLAGVIEVFQFRAVRRVESEIDQRDVGREHRQEERAENGDDVSPGQFDGNGRSFPNRCRRHGQKSFRLKVRAGARPFIARGSDRRPSRAHRSILPQRHAGRVRKARAILGPERVDERSDEEQEKVDRARRLRELSQRFVGLGHGAPRSVSADRLCRRRG